MNPLAERKGFKIESILPKQKKIKEKKPKPKPIDHVHIIDDDAPVPYNTTTELKTIVNDEIVSVDDAPVVVGIVDERPSEIREKERFKDVKRWRTTAFEEVPEPSNIGPQPKPNGSSHQKQNLSDDSDPEIDRGQSRRNDDPDLSPPRRKTQQNDDDPSPPRRKRQADDDPSPPRRRDTSSHRRKHDDSSPPRRKRQSDDDSSPPRRNRQSNDDPSPPRRPDTSSHRRKHDDSSPPRRKRQSDDDSSPPRRHDTSSHRRKHKHIDDQSPPRHRDRSSSSHRRNDQHFRKELSSSTHHHQPKVEPSSPSTSRRIKQESSPPTFQPAKSERRRLAEHKEKITERYAQWGRGLAQVQQKEDAIKDYLDQAEKPLARYRDDKDLDTMLKQKEREDDPMLKYLSNRTSDVGDRKSNNNNNVPVKPRYKGPDPQKNRFDIWPGYRWDGVDRSNGYEKKLFESIANRHAKAQEAYLWSVEDM